MVYRKKTTMYRRKLTFRNKARRYKRRAYRPSASGTFAKRVKNVIQKTAEAKVVDYFIGNKAITSVLASDWMSKNVLILTADTTANGMYQISQNSYQGGRIGNRVTTRSAILKGSIVCNAFYDGTNNYNPQPMFVTMWIVKLKPHLNDDVATLDTVRGSSFFQHGGNAVGFAGSIVDMQKTVNQNHVTLLKKRVFKVGMGNYVSGYGVNTANNANQQYNTNDAVMSKLFKMNITKIMPKAQSFNDGTDITVARRVWMFFSVCRVDGGLIQTSGGYDTGTIPVYANIGLEYRYTDV